MQATGPDWGDMREITLRPEDVEVVDDAKYFVITPHWSPLVHFVSKGAPNLVGKVPRSLTSCDAVQELVRRRNEATWPSSTPGNTCALFDDDTDKKPVAKRVRRSKDPHQEVKSVLVELPAVGSFPAISVPFKRPVHPCDRLVLVQVPWILGLTAKTCRHGLRIVAPASEWLSHPGCAPG
jgi:hypothetical protein